jgi:hypothetical protein
MSTNMTTQDAIWAEVDYRREQLRSSAQRRGQHGWLVSVFTHRTRRHG